MALTNKERQELKNSGYIYHRPLAQWMKPEEIDAHEKKMEAAGQLQFYACLVIAIGLFIWIFAAS